MTEITNANTVNLLNQMRVMAAQASNEAEQVTNPQSFGNIFRQTIDSVNDLQQQSDQLKTRFELGDPDVGLSEVMIAGQKSAIGFEATLRVRNKLVQAYQDIMNMPI